MTKGLSCHILSRSKQLVKEKHISYIHTLRLLIGQSKRTDCPYCGGKNTFSVSRTNTEYLWHCFRASCKVKGHEKFLPDATTLAERLRVRSERNESSFLRFNKDDGVSISWSPPDWFTSVFSDERSLRFCERWALIPAYETRMVSLFWDPKLERVVFACRRRGNGEVVDAVGRSIRNGVKPKWYRYGNSRECFIVLPPEPASDNLGTAVRQEDTHIVLVEDCLSAIRVALSGVSAMALLGTHLTTEAKYALFGKSVIIALDADASKLSLKLQQSLALVCKQVSAVFLQDDLKYCSIEQVREILRIGETKT